MQRYNRPLPMPPGPPDVLQNKHMAHRQPCIRNHLSEVFNPHKGLGSHGGAPLPLPEANLRVNRGDSGLRPSPNFPLIPHQPGGQARAQATMYRPTSAAHSTPSTLLSPAASADACVPPSTSDIQGLFRKKRARAWFGGLGRLLCGPLPLCPSVRSSVISSASMFALPQCGQVTVGRWQWDLA